MQLLSCANIFSFFLSVINNGKFNGNCGIRNNMINQTVALLYMKKGRELANFYNYLIFNNYDEFV